MSGAETGFLRQRAVLDMSRVDHVTVRGVTWVTDGYMMARADLFRTLPKAKMGGLVPTGAARRLLDAVRGAGRPVADAHSRLTGHRTPEVWLLSVGRSSVLGVNAAAAAEWLAHPWEAITQPLNHPAVVFWQKRRGKRSLAGLLMPVYIGHGTFGIEPLTAACDEEAEVA